MPIPSFQNGWMFGNYVVPVGTFGEILSADDLRYHFLFGITLTAGEDGRECTDDQLRKMIDFAVATLETELDLVIRKRIYRTNYTGPDVRVPKFNVAATDKWTHIEDAYPFIKREWANQGYITLSRKPLLSVERAILKTPVGQTLIDLLANHWVRPDYEGGQLRLYPVQGTTFPIYGPYLGSSGLILDNHWGDYADAYEIDASYGFQDASFVPEDLREVIGKLAAIGAMGVIGDGLLAGFSSSSVSIDGLNEAFSSTQSPENSTDFKTKISIKNKHTDAIVNIEIGVARQMFVAGLLDLTQCQTLAVNPEDAQDVQWKDLTDITEHDSTNKKCYRITAGGKTVGLTEDHSLFVIQDGKLEEIKGRDVRMGTLIGLWNQEKGSYDGEVTAIEEYRPENNKTYDLTAQDFFTFVAYEHFILNDTYFGARIRQYAGEVKEYIKNNRYKRGGAPILVA